MKTHSIRIFPLHLATAHEHSALEIRHFLMPCMTTLGAKQQSHNTSLSFSPKWTLE